MLMLRSGTAEAAGNVIACATQRGFDAVTQAAHPVHSFLRLAWFEAAAKRPLRFVTAFRPTGEPLAALAIERRPIAPAQVPGSYWPFRSFPFVADAREEEIVELLVQSEVKALLGRMWRMGPVLADDPAACALRKAAPRCGWTVLQRTLGDTFDLNFAALRAAGPWPRHSTAAKNRWRERRLAEHGELQFRSVRGNDWTTRDLDDMAAVEAGSWLGKLDKGADFKFNDPEQRRIWERAARDPDLAQLLFASILRIGERPAAFVFGLDLGSTRHVIANNFDQHFAKYAPGKVLLYRDFARAADDGVMRIHWGTGDAGYKSEMGATRGAEVLDLLFVRSSALATLLRPFWYQGHPLGWKKS